MSRIVPVLVPARRELARRLRGKCAPIRPYGAPRGNRTPNPLIKSQLLCQLS
jgi:hypothetical protein